MKISQNNYLEYVSSKTPRTNEWKTLIWAFLVGGGICTIGQIAREFVEYEFWQLSEDEVSAVVSGFMIFLGATFTGVGLYDRLGAFAGAGSMVPITGFANSIVSPALEFKSEGMIYGLAAKMFIISGPIIVYGVVASSVVGLIYMTFGL
ncbi:MAG: SpoVA/SpoVAEb family sporulation membrane protein [Bacillota bacterium]